MSSDKNHQESPYGIIGNRRIPERATRGLRQCPYCPNQIHTSHLPLHLSKCRKRDPKNSELFLVCEYDYSHHILRKNMAEHLQECPAKDAFLFREIRAGNGTLEEQMDKIKAELLTMNSEEERKRRQKQITANKL